LEPLARYAYFNQLEHTETQTSLGITQELAYRDEKQRIRLFLHAMQDEESLFAHEVSGRGGDTKYFTSIFNYDYNFNIGNKVNVQLYYAHYRDLFNIDELKDISGYLSLTNNYEDFDFYNGVVWHRNSIDWENYFDLTSSVSWNVNEDLTMTLKGYNLLDKAKKTRQFTVDNPINPTQIGVLEITPYDQRIMLELEYLF